MFKQARNLLQTWLDAHRHTPVRLLGVGVSGLEAPDKHGLVFDSAQQTALDQAVDKIKRYYGDDKAMRALTLKRKKKLDSS